VADGAAGAQEGIAVVGVAKLHPQGAAVPEVRLDLLSEVPQAEDHAADAVVPEQLDLVVDERPPGDRDECLGDRRADRPEPCGQTAGQQGDGDLGNGQRRRTAHGGGAPWGLRRNNLYKLSCAPEFATSGQLL